MFIIVLGGGIDLNGSLPSHVYQRLDKALELYRKNPNQKIVLSGKYSFLYQKQKPPITEAKKMQDYLLQKGVPRKQTLLETYSKDTIGNAYYLKKNVFLPHRETQAQIVTSHFHLERVKYIFQKIFGKGYKFDFHGIQEHIKPDEETKVVTHQKELLLKTRELLSKMEDGDHNFLKNKIYKLKFYREKRPEWVMNFVARGK